jgi:hypothetical protein
VNTARAIRFVAVLAASLIAHDLGDYYMQTGSQSWRKRRRGHADHHRDECTTRATCAHRTRTGRLACAGHVASYTATQVALLALVSRVLGLGLGWRAIAAGQLVSAVTHYYMDREYTAQAMHDALGKGFLHRLGPGAPFTGGKLLDQTWHKFWLFVAALATAVLAEKGGNGGS